MNQTSRQSEKTLAAIRDAFTDLILSKRYDDISMREVSEHANVGRSTLYTHFRDKECLLADHMSPLLLALAKTTRGAKAEENVEAALSHIWAHRDRGRVVLFGETGRKLEAQLAARIQAHYESEDMCVPPSFVALPIAAAIFAVMQAWLLGRAACTPQKLAKHICRLSEAMLETGLHDG